MKNKQIILSLLAVSQMMALSIDEAVVIALEKSHMLSSKTHKIKASRSTEALLASSYKPTLSLGYNYSKRDIENFIKKKKESLFNASLDYNLFNGFYDKYSIKSQESLTRSETYLRQSALADLRQETKNSYLSLLQSLKMQQVADEAVTLLQNQLRDSQNLFTQGIIPKSKYLKVKVELQNAKQEQLKADSSLVDQRNRLSALLQQTIDTVTLQESSIERDERATFENLYTLSLNNRSELRYLEALKQSQQESIKALNSANYPKIGLSLEYNKYGDELLPDKFSYGALGEIDDEVVGSVNLSYDLYSGGKVKNQKSVHKYQILSLEEDIKETKLDIKLQLQQALEKIKVTKGEIEVTKLSIDEAKEHYRMTNNRFKQQLDSTTDLLDARLLLTQAQNSLYQAKYEHQKAIVNLERILER